LSVTPLDVGPADTAAPLDTAEANAGPAPSKPEVKGPNRLSPRQRRAAAAAHLGANDSSVGAGPADQTLVSKEREADPGDAFRRAIADAVAKSWATIPHFAVGREVSADRLRSALAQAKASEPGVTVTDFLLSAFAGALRAGNHPGDVGLAVATEWGVIIPVVPDVTGCSIEEIATRRRAAVTRARGRRLASGDAVVPFATLSNLGPFGVSWFTGIIPLGQTGLLTVGEIAERAVVSGGEITVRPQFSATFTADHRLLDGVQSAELLGRFAGAVEALHQEDVS
jgi:pyruvate dehydrogenase E2 component (dihydrolipoamide acetyltransferase)